MDALLIIDATPGQFPSSPPQPLVDLIDRARGVGGVIVHVAPTALGADPDDDPAAQEQPRLRIDSVLGTRDDELVLVSAVPDVFEGIDDLAEGLDDLGVDRIIMAGSNAREALMQSSFAALAIGFELILVADGAVNGADGTPVEASVKEADEAAGDPSGRAGRSWVADLEAGGAVVRSGADVWLKM